MGDCEQIISAWSRSSNEGGCPLCWLTLIRGAHDRNMGRTVADSKCEYLRMLHAVTKRRRAQLRSKP
jgi:hypothetical protein